MSDHQYEPSFVINRSTCFFGSHTNESNWQSWTLFLLSGQNRKRKKTYALNWKNHSQSELAVLENSHSFVFWHLICVLRIRLSLGYCIWSARMWKWRRRSVLFGGVHQPCRQCENSYQHGAQPHKTGREGACSLRDAVAKVWGKFQSDFLKCVAFCCRRRKLKKFLLEKWDEKRLKNWQRFLSVIAFQQLPLGNGEKVFSPKRNAWSLGGAQSCCRVLSVE